MSTPTAASPTRHRRPTSRRPRTLIRDVVRLTPVEPNRALAERIGGPVYLKCENLQRAGSFKIRGAYTRIARLSAAERARGVVAASAGNHAQGVALAAQMLGIPARVFMPVGAPLPKVQATRGYGAEVEFAGHDRRRGAASPRRSGRERDRRGADPPVRPPGHRRRSGHRRPGDPASSARTSARSWSAPAAAGCSPGSPTAVRVGAPDVSHRRRPGRRRGGLPGVAGGRAPGGAGVDVDDGGRDRGRPARRRAVRARPASSSTSVVTVSEELISRALLLLLERAKLVVEPAGPWCRGGPAGRRPGRRVRPARGGRAVRRQRRPAADDAGDPAR